MNTVNKVFIRWLDRIMSITCLSCEVGVHWLLWQACKKQMIMQNRQSNTKNTHKNKLLLFNYLLKADILINYWKLIFLLITESWYSYYLLKADILIINWKLIFLLFTESWCSYYLLKDDILIIYGKLIFLLFTESWYSYYLLKADERMNPLSQG